LKVISLIRFTTSRAVSGGRSTSTGLTWTIRMSSTSVWRTSGQSAGLPL
jgi:hypothetical protein